MQSFRERTFFLSLFLAIAAASWLWWFSSPEQARFLSASASQNVTGWAWSDMPHGSDEVRTPGAYAGRGAGWISFNSQNCDANDDGRSDGTPVGCPPTGTVMAQYGTHISPTDGTFSGQAWSEHLGWLSFNRSETGPPPASPYNGSESFIAKLDFTTRQISGWGRFLASCRDNLWDGQNFKCTGTAAGDRAGDWDGWVKFRGATTLDGGSYGVNWEAATAALKGWAWGDKVVGWISMNCLNQGVCATSNYAARASVDTVPPTVSVDQPNGVLATTTNFRVTLTASDVLTGVEEGNVDVKIDGAAWGNGGLPGTPAGSILPPGFDYTGERGKLYEFRFQARDGAGNWSDFASDGALVINRSPNTPDPSSPESGANTFSSFPVSPLTPIVRWSAFVDPDGAGKHIVGGSPPGGSHGDADSQQAYHVQIATEPGFSETSIVCGVSETSNPRCFYLQPSNELAVPAGALVFDKSYFWRVKVRDNHAFDSGFGGAATAANCRGLPAETCAFYTPPSSPPAANFSFAPQAPSVNEDVRFTDLSSDATDAFNCPRGGCSVVAWDWDFADGTPHASAQNPIHRYTTKGQYAVTLRVRDNDNQWSQPFSKTVSIRPELPEFKEVAPR